jgi:hypothetical protein
MTPDVVAAVDAVAIVAAVVAIVAVVAAAIAVAVVVVTVAAAAVVMTAVAVVAVAPLAEVLQVVALVVVLLALAVVFAAVLPVAARLKARHSQLAALRLNVGSSISLPMFKPLASNVQDTGLLAESSMFIPITSRQRSTRALFIITTVRTLFYRRKGCI